MLTLELGLGVIAVTAAGAGFAGVVAGNKAISTFVLTGDRIGSFFTMLRVSTVDNSVYVASTSLSENLFKIVK